MSVPQRDLDRVQESHRRFIRHIEGLDERDIRRNSLLPDWTIAHVLAHVARNADSHIRRTVAAIKGVMVDQYPGGSDGRAAEIDATARQPANTLIEDVATSARALDLAWQSVPVEAWTGISRDVGGIERQLHDLPARRWQEVEVHLVDLGIGVSHREWTDEFVETWLPRTRAQMMERLPERIVVPQLEDERDELAWLYGRLHRDDLPPPPPWG